MDKVRLNKDIDIYERNGIPMVRANGKGISLFTEVEIQRTRFEGWAWRIPSGTPMPSGLGLFNGHPGHFMICPIVRRNLFRNKSTDFIAVLLDSLPPATLTLYPCPHYSSTSRISSSNAMTASPSTASISKSNPASMSPFSGRTAAANRRS